MSNVDAITESVLKYTKDGEAAHAMLLTGQWGSGKTRYIKNVLKSRLEEVGFETVIVSASGVQDGKELLSRLAQAMVAKSLSKGGEGASKRSKTIGSALAEAGAAFVKSKLADRGFSYEPSSETVISLLCDEKSLIVIDDFERRVSDDADVFGAISELVEIQDRRVLLVQADEGKAIDPDLLEKYVFGTFRFEPDHDDLIEAILPEAFGGFPDELEAREIFRRQMITLRCRNARILLRCRDLLPAYAGMAYLRSESYDTSEKREVTEKLFRFTLLAAWGMFPDGIRRVREEGRTWVLGGRLAVEQLIREHERGICDFRFVETYFATKNLPSVETMNEGVESFLRKRFPQSLVQRRAGEFCRAIDIYDIEDDDARDAVEAISGALRERDCEFSSVLPYLLALYSLKQWGFLEDESWSKALNGAKAIFSSNISQARNYITENSLEWRFDACRDKPRPDDITKVASWVLNEAAKGAGDALSKSMPPKSEASFRSVTDLVRNEQRCSTGVLALSSLEPTYFVESLMSSRKAADVFSFRKELTGVQSLPANIGKEEAQRVVSWAAEVLGLLSSSNPPSKMHAVHIGMLKNDLHRIIENYGAHIEDSRA